MTLSQICLYLSLATTPMTTTEISLGNLYTVIEYKPDTTAPFIHTAEQNWNRQVNRLCNVGAIDRVSRAETLTARR